MGAPVKIGLEIHGYLDVPSQVKLFCNCSLAPAEPNTNICPVCTGQPGSKPMLPNSEAIDAILRIALFLDCKLNPELLWQRKHYSWPDLPNGYQKTMSGAYSQPVGLNGHFLGIGIEEIHLEEDPARWDPVSGGVDYNRSGYPLVEIVTKPEFTSSTQVREWIENLMVALSYIKAVRRDLGVKCDVNVSIAPSYIRTEVKNVNSFSAIVESIEYEIKRQGREDPKQQTRAWEEQSGTTVFMRSKETAVDYQFIPDPDLPTIHVTKDLVEPLLKHMPERPDQKQAKFEKLKIPKDKSLKLSANLFFANEAEADIHALKIVPAEFIADRYLNEIRGAWNSNTNEEVVLKNFRDSREVARQLIAQFSAREITNLHFKKRIDELLRGEFSQSEFDSEQQERKAVGAPQLMAWVKEAIAANPKAAADVKAGNDKAINAIVGHVMKQTKGSVDPAVIQTLVRKFL